MLKKIITMVMVVFLLFVSTDVNAAIFEDNRIVEANKVWTITFNVEVILDDVTRQAINVTDTQGNIIKTALSFGKDEKIILVNPPTGGYIQGKKYVLNIGTKVKSKNGSNLQRAEIVNFSIKSSAPVSYAKYEEKMKTFGFDKLYNNKSAKSSELVTKTEALKLALSVTFNTNDISGFAEEHNEYDGAIWVEFAKYHKITTEDINITNYNDKAIYMDVISYFENCKIKFLKEKLVKEVSVNLNDISKYSSEQQAAIKDMIANGIISSLTSSLNGDTSITKGQLNELVVNFAEKYNTIAMKGDIITTDLDKMPSNVDKYAYILSNVDKYIYELPFTIEYQPDSRNPKELYAVKKNVYPQAREYSEAFFDSILNIDYQTITEESFENQIAPYTVLAPNKSAIKVYVKYVKDNQIVLEGKSSLQVPIIYSDGFSYRARLNLKFEIKHSKTKQNLLYLDFFEDSNKIYAKTSYDFLVDYYLTDKYKDTDMYLTENELYKTILQKDKCGITREIIK
jgi:hypothetical protein